jgi:hypothetical protein
MAGRSYPAGERTTRYAGDSKNPHPVGQLHAGLIDQRRGEGRRKSMRRGNTSVDVDNTRSAADGVGGVVSIAVRAGYPSASRLITSPNSDRF